MGDWLVALVVAFIGAQEVWFPAPGFSVPVGPRWAMGVAYLASSAALVWRRRWPFGVLVFSSSVLAVLFLAFGAPQGLGTVLPVMVAFYSVGRRSTLATFGAGLLVTAAYTAIHEVMDPAFEFNGFAVIIWMIVVGSGFLGLLLRERAAEVRAAAQASQDMVVRASSEQEAAVSGERERIVAELQDVVGQGVGAIVVQLEGARAVLETGDVAGAQVRLASLEGSARTTMSDMRDLVHVLDAS
jgi:signal transduction histidine kinase